MPRAATIAWTVTCLAVLGAAACGDGGPGTGTPDAIRDVPADVATPDAVDDATEPRDTPTELPHDDLAASDDGEDCGPGCGDEAPGDEAPGAAASGGAASGSGRLRLVIHGSSLEVQPAPPPGASRFERRPRP